MLVKVCLGISSMKLSHSAESRYQDCGESYRLHYIEKLRPDFTTSALLFGDALDKTHNAILEDKRNDTLKSTEDYHVIFLKGWTHGTINKHPLYIPTSPKVLYSTKDFVVDLLTTEDYKLIDQGIEDGTFSAGDITEISYRKNQYGWNTLSEQEKSFHNLHCWLSMKNKARYFIQGYIEQVLPRIKKVHAVQVKIDAANAADNAFTGVVDFIADIDDHGTCIIDNKSSSALYKHDSVRTSEQLAKYVYFEGPKYNTNKGAYIVTKKHLKTIENKTCTVCGHTETSSHKTCNKMTGKKRCDGEWSIVATLEPVIQIIVDDIAESFQEEAVIKVDKSFVTIDAGVFKKNLSKCSNWFGMRCPYSDLCHRNDATGLVNVKDIK